MSLYIIGIIFGGAAIIALTRELLLHWTDVRRQRRMASQISMREVR